MIHTVTGPISADDMGVTLPHEHALCDFAGANETRMDSYDHEEAFAVCLPHFQHLREAGCQTFVDCTPAYIGRNVLLLKRLSETTGVRAANTGAWIEYDNIGRKPAEHHVALIARMVEEGLGSRVLLSQDAGWYQVGEQEDAKFTPYHGVLTEFVPELRRAMADLDPLSQFFVVNPREAFTPRVRRA